MRRPIFYLLDAAGNPVPVRDVLQWARWFETADRHLAYTEVGASVVSTVFLSIDRNYSEGPPILWQTKVATDGKWEDIELNYPSAAAARAGHQAVVDVLRKRNEGRK